LNCTN